MSSGSEYEPSSTDTDESEGNDSVTTEVVTEIIAIVQEHGLELRPGRDEMDLFIIIERLIDSFYFLE